MNDIDIINQPEILFEKKIVLYGASQGGKSMLAFLNRCNIYPLCFCDRDELKWGKKINDYTILSPDNLVELNQSEDIIIVISSNFLKEILCDLSNKIQTDNIFSGYSVRLALRFYCLRKPKLFKKEFIEQERIMHELFNAQGSDYSFQQNTHLDKFRLAELLTTNKDIVLCHTPQKVGSSSVYESLNGDKFFILHFHDIELFLILNNLDMNFWNRICVLFKKQKKKIRIITGVREPISHDLSNYFHILHAMEGLNYKYNLSFLKNVRDYFYDICTPNDKKYTPKCYGDYAKNELKYGRIFDWFDHELNKFWGINIYRQNFNRDIGYSIYKNNNIEIFVFKLEKLSTLEKEIGEFIGDAAFKLKNANESKAKPYYKLYKDYLNEVEIPKEILNFYYNCNEYMDYFYTEEEKVRFLDKWITK